MGVMSYPGEHNVIATLCAINVKVIISYIYNIIIWTNLLKGHYYTPTKLCLRGVYWNQGVCPSRPVLSRPVLSRPDYINCCNSKTTEGIYFKLETIVPHHFLHHLLQGP